ncbi:MAG: TonB-dependent receptor [Gammaproteobacteria bacterium]|nr:TonB-dependent receptor [Gammaproteobacteria bacterium]MXY04718.1 TonB-dependent receptor [Gammaproteobacteria bacterium]MYE53355.1 TonB-dependent receptor [Gammaproteobacteria bacterium]MYF50131.1 TonB-dependent receptor [Gammaproteobacteria bacterium]MYG11984.1 TonB-dependent receptor [Gammaproteobacteria bacterium]
MNRILERLASVNRMAHGAPTLARSALACLILTLTAVPAAIADSVSGSVTDAANTVSFQGAVVSIDGLEGTATTDDRGRFRLSNVPAGTHTLVISYVGTASTRIEITVPPEGLNLGDVVIGEADLSGLVEEVIVYGQAAAFASALNQERAAVNTVSVLDTDAMGQFPDQNVAEAVRRLSGVTVENDQGEGRYVVIRGMDPDLNSTSINGVRATAAEPRRALQLDVIPSDVLDGIEVNKSLTPDMDGDAIGGSINVKTLSAFSRKGPYAKARVEQSHNEIRDAWSPKASIAGSNVFELEGARRLGVAGAFSWHDRKLQADNAEADDWDVADDGNDFLEEFQPRLYKVERERIGAVLNFDLDVSESTALHLYTLYSRFKDTELRNRTTFGLDGLDESALTPTRMSFSEVEIERDTKGRDMRGQIAENLSISFGSDTQLDAWQIETNVGYSYARERTPDQVSGTWVAEFESGDGNIPDGQPVLTIDRSDPKILVAESAFWSVLQDASLYELDELEHLNEKNEDTQYSFRLDATRDMDFGIIKFGAKARLREKKTNEEVGLWSGDDAWFLSDVLLPDGGSAYGFPTPMDPVPDNSGERDILAGGRGIEFEDVDSRIDSNVADFKFDENVFAVYGMTRWDNGPLAVTAGLRVEWTRLDSSGSITELIEEGGTYNGAVLDDDTVFITPVDEKKSYTDFLPSINARYEFNEDLIGRASVHKSVVRPRVEDVAFRVEIDGDEAELGNPSLDPFRAWNADVSLSFYPTDLSVMSAGLFWKRIDDFIFIQTIDDYPFAGRVFDEATVAQNGDQADGIGIELNYQQHFGFLGAPWDAFLVGVNYTHVDSSAKTIDGRKIDLPKQSKNIAGFVLGYDKHGFDIRLAMKYRDRYIDSLEGEGEDRYTHEHLQWDLTVKYSVTDSWLVYAEISNLGDRPEYYYSGRRNRALQYDEFGTTAAIGVQYNFR